MTTKRTWNVLTILALLVAAATVIWACNAATQPSTTPATQEQVAQEQVAPPAADIAAVETAGEPEVTSDAPADEANTAETSGDGVPAAALGAEVRIFTLDQSQSQASFTLDEELMGAPKTVVGTTSLVDGSITIDLAELSKTTVSPIQIDAGDFTTDNDMRNNAIRRFVLQSNSEANRYITFTPTVIDGLPSEVEVGATFQLQITGDLTISGVTNPVTFVTDITVASESQISGRATAQVLRSDYNLTIPSVPSVANVGDQVQLELLFVAYAQS